MPWDQSTAAYDANGRLTDKWDTDSNQAHTLSSATITDNTGTRTNSYGYDAAGNSLSRPGANNGQQQLSWDAEGHLGSVTDGLGTSSFLYDANGNRLIRRDPGGITLYLPSTELRLTTATGQVTGTCYYSHAGQLVAMRTAAGVSWLMSDPQGTSMIAITATDQTATKRWQTPFGGPRGSVPSWPNERGFVGGTMDPIGTTHLGARGHWWDQAWNKAKSGFHTALKKHKAEIAGAAVGLAVGVGCGVAIGWTGVGAVACVALAGTSRPQRALLLRRGHRSVDALEELRRLAVRLQHKDDPAAPFDLAKVYRIINRLVDPS